MSEVRYRFTASMDVEAEHEALFNEVYDTEHVPLLLKVPGVISVTRIVNEDFDVSMGGETRRVSNDGEPRYSAVYELENADVLKSTAWSDAVDQGRWPEQVRPYTYNRRHTLHRVL
ncbi:MAG: hypothetical protein K0U93_12520 [Gammaproteobacteria bacterium]|nr:hypothetical protein [Gammaproteobacteria bacterium]